MVKPGLEPLSSKSSSMTQVLLLSPTTILWTVILLEAETHLSKNFSIFTFQGDLGLKKKRLNFQTKKISIDRHFLVYPDPFWIPPCCYILKWNKKLRALALSRHLWVCGKQAWEGLAMSWYQANSKAIQMAGIMIKQIMGNPSMSFWALPSASVSWQNIMCPEFRGARNRHLLELPVLSKAQYGPSSCRY